MHMQILDYELKYNKNFEMRKNFFTLHHEANSPQRLHKRAKVVMFCRLFLKPKFMYKFGLVL